MKEFIDKLISELKEEHERCINRYGIVGGNAPAMEVKQCIDIVNELAEEYKVSEIPTGWIPVSERLPSKEECGVFGSKEFQVTIPQHDGNKTISMHFDYETVRGKEVARWKWRGNISPWKVIAWKPLDAPYTEGE